MTMTSTSNPDETASDQSKAQSNDAEERTEVGRLLHNEAIQQAEGKRIESIDQKGEEVTLIMEDGGSLTIDGMAHDVIPIWRPNECKNQSQ